MVQMVKNSPANAGDQGSIPGSGRFPREDQGNSLWYSCLENPMDWGAWQATVQESQRVRHDWVTNIHTWGSSSLIQKLQRYTWLRNRYSYKFWDSFLAVFHYSILSSLKHTTINISKKKNKRLKCASLVHWKTMISCFYSLLQRYL